MNIFRRPSQSRLPRVIARSLIAALICVSLPPTAQASFTRSIDASPIDVVDSFADLPSLAQQPTVAVLIFVADDAAYAVVMPADVFSHVVSVASDPEFANKYHRARWMDPRVGRWSSVDTWRGSVSAPSSLQKYGYTTNDPANRIDPSGYFECMATMMTALSLINTLNAISIPNRDAFVADAITYSATEKIVQNPSDGYYKEYRARIAARGAKDRLLVVQWVRGHRKVNGAYVVADRFHGLENVKIDFPVWQIDARERIAEFTSDGLTKTNRHIDLFDNPGTHRPLIQGETFDNDLHFMVNAYDKHVYGTLPFDSFIDPENPRPLISRSWDFVGSYTVEQ